MRIIGGGRFHHRALPGSIPALVCPLRSLLCARADDDPGSTPPLPLEHINHLHSSHATTGEREGGREMWWGVGGEAFASTSLIPGREKRKEKEEAEVGVAAADTSAPVISVRSHRMPRKEPRRQDMTQPWGRACVCVCVCVCSAVVDFIFHLISLKSEQTPGA